MKYWTIFKFGNSSSKVIWGFLKIGVPPNHLFWSGFPYKPTISGYPDYGTPMWIIIYIYIEKYKIYNCHYSIYIDHILTIINHVFVEQLYTLRHELCWLHRVVNLLGPPWLRRSHSFHGALSHRAEKNTSRNDGEGPDRWRWLVRTLTDTRVNSVRCGTPRVFCREVVYQGLIFHQTMSVYPRVSNSTDDPVGKWGEQ